MKVLNNFGYGDGKMYNENTLEIINEEIEIKREKLNEMLLMGKSNDLVLKLSMELDIFINLYYESLYSIIYSKLIN